ncbi:hypothetical protein SAMN04489712_11597 [Thermomonospora echinospora]|uniref:Uncharacterized protein n=1 Tax=Thermomonospora echinospora TaxID=1992 RepID=A0A1H6DC94_9ACTN|nr:hypothetical protein [Thermomonospora echinospora]SEG82859.1 hypothetical protein SAMN04489712_11597 [Thermomonospora echinospora]
MPYVIKSVFPERVGLFTGLAMMLMSTGAAMSSDGRPLDAVELVAHRTRNDDRADAHGHLGTVGGAPGDAEQCADPRPSGFGEPHERV